MSVPKLPAATAERKARRDAIRKRASVAIRKEEREVEQRPLDFALIRRLWTYTFPYAVKRNWLALTVVLRALQLPLIGQGISWTLTYAVDGGSSSTILTATAWTTALMLFTQFTFHFRQRLALELGEAVIHDLRRDIVRHLQSMPMSWFNKTKIGRIISRVTSDAEALRVGVQDVLFVGIVGLGQMLATSILMAWHDWKLFLVVAALSPVIFGLSRAFHGRLSRAYRRMQESFSGLTATLAESINGVKVIQGYAREEVNSDLFAEQVSAHGKNVFRAVRLEGVLLPLLELSSQSFLIALVLVGGWSVLNPHAPSHPAKLLHFFFLANYFFGPIQHLGNMYNQTLTAMAGAERVFAFLDTPPEWSDADDAYPLPPIKGRVAFENVSFAYVGERMVLHDISFEATPGQSVALVGKTGSGKSSIVNLVARFYLANRGTVSIDGHDLRNIQADSLHHQMGLVLQNNFLFTGTVRDNIRLGKPAATDDEVVDACRKLDCLDLLEALPQGLDTQVGERGAQLSLGQRQLVCFARAMIADPRIVILDEATSSIDTLTEARLQAALAKLLAGRTSFIVAHRLSTIRNADQVLVLEDGRIVERGTHDELMAHGRVYAESVKQFVAAAV